MEDEKDVLARGYRNSPVFTGYQIFTRASLIKKYVESAIFRFHENKRDNPILAVTNLYGNIINIHPFEDGNERICCLILAHALIQMKCCLFHFKLLS